MRYPESGESVSGNTHRASLIPRSRMTDTQTARLSGKARQITENVSPIILLSHKTNFDSMCLRIKRFNEFFLTLRVIIIWVSQIISHVCWSFDEVFRGFFNMMMTVPAHILLYYGLPKMLDFL